MKGEEVTRMGLCVDLNKEFAIANFFIWVLYINSQEKGLRLKCMSHRQPISSYFIQGRGRARCSWTQSRGCPRGRRNVRANWHKAFTYTQAANPYVRTQSAHSTPHQPEVLNDRRTARVPPHHQRAWSRHPCAAAPHQLAQPAPATSFTRRLDARRLDPTRLH